VALSADPLTLAIVAAPPDDEPYTSEQQRRDIQDPLGGLLRLRVRGWRIQLCRTADKLHVLAIEKRGDAYR